MQSSRELLTVVRGVCLFLVAISLGLGASFAQSADDTNSDKLTQSFSKAALTALADIYRWKEKARIDAKSSIPPNPNAGELLKTRAYEEVRQAQLSAKSQGDQKAGNLLQQHFNQVNAWISQLIDERKNLDASNTMDPGAVDNNPALININECEKSFNAMLGHGTYTDIVTCQ
jgi:hypothetical protein